MRLTVLTVLVAFVMSAGVLAQDIKVPELKLSDRKSPLLTENIDLSIIQTDTKSLTRALPNLTLLSKKSFLKTENMAFASTTPVKQSFYSKLKEEPILGISAGDGDDFKEYQFFYRKSRYNVWGGFGNFTATSFKSTFYSFYGDWLSKNDPDADGYLGVGVGIGKYSFNVMNQVSNKFDTVKTVFVGRGTEVKLNVSINFFSDSRYFTYWSFKGGVVLQTQHAENKRYEFDESYVNPFVELEVVNNENTKTFNKTKLNFYAQIQPPNFGQSSKKTDRISGDISDGDIYDHTYWYGRIEQNIHSVPIKKRRLAFTLGVVGQYLHREADMKDIYSGGAILSLYYKYNEVVQFYYGVEFGSIKNEVAKLFWAASNLLEVYRAIAKK